MTPRTPQGWLARATAEGMRARGAIQAAQFEWRDAYAAHYVLAAYVHARMAARAAARALKGGKR